MTDEELRKARLILLSLAGALSLIATFITLYIELRK